MWLAFYNPEGIGDVLLLTKGTADKDLMHSTTKDDVTVVFHKETKEALGVNIHHASRYFPIEQVDKVHPVLDQPIIDKINEMLNERDFNLTIAVDSTPKFVVGYVEECQPHTDSDHLSITQTKVGEDEVLQIVCGANNIAQGQHVLVAKPGAVLPSGMIIWPSELRGVPSFGMICSTNELNLEHLENYPGIWELSSKFAAGTPLEEVVADYQ